jgi:hypothetical protein
VPGTWIQLARLIRGITTIAASAAVLTAGLGAILPAGIRW